MPSWRIGGIKRRLPTTYQGETVLAAISLPPVTAEANRHAPSRPHPAGSGPRRTRRRPQLARTGPAPAGGVTACPPSTGPPPGHTPVPGQNTSGQAHDGQSGRGNPRSRPGAAYASTASGHDHTMATGDTASDPLSRSAQHGRPDPEDVPPAGAATGSTPACCPGPTARCVRRRAAREAPFRNKRRSEDAGDAEGDA